VEQFKFTPVDTSIVKSELAPVWLVEVKLFDRIGYGTLVPHCSNMKKSEKTST